MAFVSSPEVTWITTISLVDVQSLSVPAPVVALSAVRRSELLPDGHARREREIDEEHHGEPDVRAGQAGRWGGRGGGRGTGGRGVQQREQRHGGINAGYQRPAR